MTDKEKFYRAAALCVLLVLLNFFVISVMQKRNKELKEQIKELIESPGDTVRIVKVDTLLIAKPVPVYKYVKDVVEISDTLLIHDTTERLVFLPKEHMVYKDSTYRAVVSGVQPSLDTIEVYPKTVTETVTKYVKSKDKRRWGAGVHVGAGWNGKEISPYVGVGIQYNLVRW